jgi:hypothetical protein
VGNTVSANKVPGSELPALGFCEKHQVFLHEVGCIVCNVTD